MDRTLDIPGLFLPVHLRLGPTNWSEYRHAVETICRLQGVDPNLKLVLGPDELPAGKAQEEWLRKDELCKAIITLNIKDFPRYGIRAGPNTPACGIWSRLVEMHTKKRRCWEGWFAWIRPLTGLEKFLLLAIVLLLWLWAQSVTELNVVVARRGRRY